VGHSKSKKSFMNEETEKKTVEQEPVKTENGDILDKPLEPLEKNTGFPNFPVVKTLKYAIETKEQKIRRLTKDKQEIWLETFKNNTGSSYREINEKTGTPISTFYYWYNNDDEFRKGIVNIKKDMQDAMEDILVLKARGGNIPALKFWLQANHPKYSKKIKVEQYTGNKTYEDIIDEINQDINKLKDEERNNKNKEGNRIGSGDDGEREEESNEQTSDRESTENQKQEGEDSPISA